MKPEILIEVRFRTESEGGRLTPVQGNFYACPLFIDGIGFDCRIYLNNLSLQLGETYTVPVKFLNIESVQSRLVVGTKIVLWEGKDVADGSIVKILPFMEF